MILPILIMALLAALVAVGAAGARLYLDQRAREARRTARARQELTSLRRRYGEGAAHVVENAIKRARSGRKLRHLRRVEKLMKDPAEASVPPAHDLQGATATQ